MSVGMFDIEDVLFTLLDLTKTSLILLKLLPAIQAISKSKPVNSKYAVP